MQVGDKVRSKAAGEAGAIGTVYEVRQWPALISATGERIERGPIICVHFPTHSLEMPPSYFEPVKCR